MDFTLICTNIQDLLINNEAVVIPAVGELKVVMESAAFSQDGKTILPPKKELVFVQCETAAECEEWMHDLGKKISESLVAQGQFEVPGLGVFIDKGEGKIEFSRNEEFDFAPDSFSLEAIPLEAVIPTEEQQPQPESKPQTEPEPQPESEPQTEPEPQPESEQQLQPELKQKPAEKPEVMANVEKVEREVCDVEHKKDCRRKWMMGIVLVLVFILVMALFVMLFKEDIIQVLKNMLYTEEELEIMKKWAAQ